MIQELEHRLNEDTVFQQHRLPRIRADVKRQVAEVHVADHETYRRMMTSATTS